MTKVGVNKILLFGILFLVLIVLISLACIPVFRENMNFSFSIASSFGAFVGGILSFFSVLLIYYSLQQQKKAFEINSFESRFFQLVDYHRKNVEAWEYKNPNSKKGDVVKGAKIFVLIQREIIKAKKILDEDLDIKCIGDILNEGEIIKLKKNPIINARLNSGPISNLFELEKLNLAYLIVFIGLGKEGRPVLESMLSERCDEDKVKVILDHFESIRANWDEKPLFKKSFSIKYEYCKYFGGHQHRLGHYYRHMYQIVKYVDNYPPFKGKYEKKYEYIKTYRSQWLTYEQAVFIYNSLSVLGRSWEYDVKGEMSEKERINRGFVTKYNLIKNILGEFISDKSLESFYPNVSFEGRSESNDIRKNWEKQYD